jgi:hypothetical protein
MKVHLCGIDVYERPNGSTTLFAALRYRISSKTVPMYIQLSTSYKDRILYIDEPTLLVEFQFSTLPTTKSTTGLNICLELLVSPSYRSLRAAVQEDFSPEFCDGLLPHPFQCASHNPSIRRQASVTCAVENHH